MCALSARAFGAFLLFLVSLPPAAGDPGQGAEKREGLRGGAEVPYSVGKGRDKHAFEVREVIDDPGPVLQDDAPTAITPPDYELLFVTPNDESQVDDATPRVETIEYTLLNDTVLDGTPVEPYILTDSSSNVTDPGDDDFGDSANVTSSENITIGPIIIGTDHADGNGTVYATPSQTPGPYKPSGYYNVYDDPTNVPTSEDFTIGPTILGTDDAGGNGTVYATPSPTPGPYKLPGYYNVSDDPTNVPTTEGCRIFETDEFLGWEFETNQPVFRLECDGKCAKLTHSCQAQYRYVTVRTYPYWFDVEIGVNGGVSAYLDERPYYDDYGSYALRTLRVVTECKCLPAQCLVDGGTKYVPHNVTAYNDCGERCTCLFGELTNCCRIRKSVTHMPFAERTRYIDAQRDISSGVHGAALKSEYDALLADHTANFLQGIHDMEWFLPYHRHYLLLFENLLRKVDCRITVPYWASELYYTDPWGSILWSGDPTWFGGGTQNQCVPDGAFTSPWTLTPSASNGCLRRELVGSVPSPMDWATLLASPASSFASFSNLLDTFHGNVHCAIGGTMCSYDSANAPEFFLWHGQVERYWYKWQSQSPAHASSYDGDVTKIMAPGSIAGGKPVSSVMDSASQGDDGVCVVYQDPLSDVSGAVAALGRLPKSTLLSTPSASTASLLARMRKWVQITSSAAGGGDRADVDPEVLAELRGRPVSSVGAEYPLGADLNDIRESIYILRSNVTEKSDGQDPQDDEPVICEEGQYVEEYKEKELQAIIREVLDVLEKYEHYNREEKDNVCCPRCE